MNQDVLHSDASGDPADRLVDASGRSFSRPRADLRRCPRCAADPSRRVASAGFGHPHPVCGRCGYEWVNESWEGSER